MKRIDHVTADPNANGSGKAGFTGGSVSQQIPRTVVTPEWANGIQEEIGGAIEAVSITLESANNAQLAQSMTVRLEQMALANHLEADPAGLQCRAGAYGAGLYVMVGPGGYFFRSADLQTWYSSSAGFAGNLNAIYYDKASALWVVVGDAAEIMTSTDGSTWTHRTKAGAYSGNFRGVTKALGLWVIVGDGGEIQTSPNGITWTHRATGSAYASIMSGIAFGNGYFVASGDHIVQRSPDGITWTQFTHPEPSAVGPIAFGNGTFITISSAEVYTSPDGQTWTMSWTMGAIAVNSLIRGQNQFIAMADSGNILMSPNGFGWRKLPPLGFGSVNFYSPVSGPLGIAFSTDANTFRRSLLI
jgi:hypothetical protein